MFDPTTLAAIFREKQHSEKRRRLGILHDAVMCAIAFAAANVIAVGTNNLGYLSGFPEKIALFTAISAAVCYFFELNSGSWRYASIPDLVAIGKSATISVLIYVLVMFLYSRGEGLPRMALLLLWFFIITFLATPRVMYRMLREGGLKEVLTGIRTPEEGDNAVLIYGINDVTEAYIRSVRTRRNSTVFIAGVIDPSLRKGSRTIQGLRVLGSLEDLPEVIEEQRRKKGFHITGISVHDNALGKDRLAKLVDTAANCGLRVSLIQDIVGVSGFKQSASPEVKPIEIEDLIGRDEIKIDLLKITNFIEGRTVLVTGAGGSIGSELCRQIARFNPRQMIVTDNSEHFLYRIETELRDTIPSLELVARIADVRNRERIDSIFAKFKPDAVFHAAAIKHVPIAERNIGEAIKTNVLGTRNCANAAVNNNASVFVLISTDKAVNPTNVMGATKRAAECYCQAMDIISNGTRFKTVRFGNVLDSHGSVVPRFKEQIAKGGPVTVTHPNVFRYFMSIPEAVRLVLNASSMGMSLPVERGRILVLNMGEPVRILDLAERMIRLAGLRPQQDIKIDFIGLRPGEKLYEELFDQNETPESHADESYFIAAPRVSDYQTINRAFSAMESSVAKENVAMAMAQLAEIVPEFSSPIEQGELPGKPVTLAAVFKFKMNEGKSGAE